MKRLNKKGMSLIEILIVVSIFAILGVLTTRSVILTLRGSRKSESQIKVKENVNYALSVIERQLRSAEEITCSGSPVTTLSYISIEGVVSSFACGSSGGVGYIASGSGMLTADDVNVTDCSFLCEQESINFPPKVSVSVTAEDVSSEGAEKGVVTLQTEIVGRN